MERVGLDELNLPARLGAQAAAAGLSDALLWRSGCIPSSVHEVMAGQQADRKTRSGLWCPGNAGNLGTVESSRMQACRNPR